MDRSQQASNHLMDTYDRLTADILTRYNALTMLCTIQSEGEHTNEKPEAIAVAGISMKMEFDGLYSSIKELLTLSRKMKELWVFGPLGKDDIHGKERDEVVEADVARVGELFSDVEARRLRGLVEGLGGKWEESRG